MKQKILIVDDMPINIELIQKSLSSDYEILIATNGKEALLKASSQNPPDLILLDIMMPEMDGYEVCTRLKLNPYTEGIPIIFVTAKDEIKDETMGFDLGAVDYIIKPINAKILKARVSAHLELKRHKDNLMELVEMRTTELSKSNEKLRMEIQKRRQAEDDLKLANLELEQRVKDRTAELARNNRLLEEEIQERLRFEERLSEKEATLRTIMDTIETGVLIIEPETRKIVDVNPHATKLIGCGKDDLIGRDSHEFICSEELSTLPNSEPYQDKHVSDCTLERVNDDPIQIRRSYAPIIIGDQQYILQSFLDISDIKHLLKKQEVSISQAKKLLRLTQGQMPRYIDLSEDLVLFINVISAPCYAEGGDHFFVRKFKSDRQGNRIKTVISLRDQSGHEVSCILRSIFTDLVSNFLLQRTDHDNLEDTISRLNDEICASGLYEGDDFLTSIDVEIDHETLIMRYVSAGHPPFLLIRGDEVFELPGLGNAGINLPLGFKSEVKYSSDEIKLEAGDKLIFYTDGLGEIPMRKKKIVLAPAEIGELAGAIVRKAPDLPVSEIMNGILYTISEIGDEEIIPPSKNTSLDDVTIIGVEIEITAEKIEENLKPSDHDNFHLSINYLYKKIEREWIQHGYESPEQRLRWVLEEALLNAWVHGNKHNPEKTITIRWRYGNDFHLEVIDEGEGFDYKSIPDPSAPDNMQKLTGRGIYIIRLFSDGLSWKRGGKHLCVTFKKKMKTFQQIQKTLNEGIFSLWDVTN